MVLVQYLPMVSGMAEQTDIEELKQRVAEFRQTEEELKRTHEELFKTARQLDLIREAQSLYIANADSARIYKLLLDTLVAITESEFGFFDEIEKTDEGPYYKRSLAISDISWDEASQKLYRQLRERNLEFRNINNLADFRQ